MKKTSSSLALPSSCEAEAPVEAVLVSISAWMRERWAAPFLAQSPNYEAWKAKSNLAKLIDGDTSEAGEAKLRDERLLAEREGAERALERKGLRLVADASREEPKA